MFEKYTQEGRRAIFFARYEATLAGHREITPEHVLIGMLRDRATRVEELFRLRQHEPSIRATVFEAKPKNKPLPKGSNLPLTMECKQVLVFAAEESDLLNDKCIDSEHLVLGVLRLPHLIAANCLNELGLTLEQAREKVRATPVPGRIRAETMSGTYAAPKESSLNFWGLVFLLLLAVAVILLALRRR